jgi:hypothetical protein
MTDVYSTVPTSWLLAAEQAFAAGGAAIDLGGGTLKVGDGNGFTPTASQIIANGGVLHQVWQGPVNGGERDPSNALQININCLIPTVDASGAEIGPFTVREFAIYDASGHLALVGTTNLPKSTSAQGQPTALQWWACYAAAVANSVTVQPPSGSWPTLGQIQAGVAGLLTANAPLSVAATLQSSGWTRWLLSIASAGLSALGVGRPATDAEFVAGTPAAGGYAFPWVQIEQVQGAISALASIFAKKTAFSPVYVTSTRSVTVAAGATRCRIKGNTAGAGGGGSYGANGAGIGGGGGAFVDALFSGLAAGQGISFSLGAAGLGGGGTPSNGTPSGTTTITLPVGSITVTSAAGGAAGNNTIPGINTPGSVATVTGADSFVTYPGAGGGYGFWVGSAAGSNSLSGGFGGASPFSGSSIGPNSSAAGQPGMSPGVGGNGGSYGNQGGNGAGPEFSIEFLP